MAATDELTPMMKQYMAIRMSLPEDIILFYRLGDFYEMFNADAERASKILGVTLTQRAGAPLCGVPYHTVDTYLAKAIKYGLKVAICEQVEDPKTAKGVVKREITRIITPGTVTEDSILESAANNFVASFVPGKNGYFGLALLDLSTGNFVVEALPGKSQLTDAFVRYSPKECIVGKAAALEPEIDDIILQLSVSSLTKVEDWTFQIDAAEQELLRHFKVHSLDGFGISGTPEIVSAAGALVRYVKCDLLHNLDHVRAIRLASREQYLSLDETTLLNLDIVPLRAHPKEATLLGVLDTTLTPMGARAMRSVLQRPFGKLKDIEARHSAVDWFYRHRIPMSAFRTSLNAVRDLERLIGRIGSGTGNGRDLKVLGTSLAALPDIKAQLAESDDPLILRLLDEICLLPDLVKTLEDAITDSPPNTLHEGGIIKEGYNSELDEYRALANDSRAWLAEYQKKEQERTGIKTLKVRHNKVFGFYIEISKVLAQQAPAEYERRQTLVNAERFITPELKEYEEKIFGAEEKSQALEYAIFQSLRDFAATKTAEVQQTAAAIAELDVIAAFADCALTNGYVRPEMHDGRDFTIRAGRHPVVEQKSLSERFVPNDTLLDCGDNQIAIITGPNMAGKSTYIRQVAVIAVMAHAGSFVPAEYARVPVMDRVFTRVGAGDDLAKGRSTFMVEMQETANILNNATAKSLIVLDEIGRGTSTFDGISIAWSVAEYLHNNGDVKAKTLFATHYHELTDLELQLKGVKNYSVQVKEQGDNIVFLRTIARGAADKSYGIQVARLAGLPTKVVSRAKEILANLEEGELDLQAQPKLAKRSRQKIDFDETTGQLHLF